MNEMFKYGLLALGGYLLYEYFYGTQTPVASTTIPPVGATSTQPGYTNISPGGSSGVVSPTSQAATSLISANVQTQLQQLADSFNVANPNAGGLNVDEWNYYLAQVTGAQITGVQGEQIIQALGESDSTRGKIVTLNSYLSALAATGLGRLGMGFVSGLGLVRGVA